MKTVAKAVRRRICKGETARLGQKKNGWLKKSGAFTAEDAREANAFANAVCRMSLS